MGGGASKKAQKVTEEAKQKSLNRRRRLLFGDIDGRAFEAVGPRDQFRAPMDATDLVTQRLGDCTELRLKFETVQREGDDGFLRDHVLEHLPLDPRLPPVQPLLRRLFHLAQAQLLALPRRKLLTCYEVLSLYGLVVHGTAEEFLELVFCMFDVDGDDQVGLLDLEASMDAFLQLPEAMNLPESEAKEMRTLDARKRNAELRVLAKKALEDFAGSDSEEEVDAAAAPKASLPSEEKAGPTATEASASASEPKAGSEAEMVSTSSKVAEGFPEPKAKPKAGCCSKPKETPQEKEAREAKAAEAKRKKEEEKKEKAEKAAAEKLRQKKEAQAKAKSKSKKNKGGACLCGPPPQLRLSFRQWLRWLQSLEFLPPKLAAAAEKLSAPKVVEGPLLSAPSVPEQPGGQTPAYGQSPTQSDETPDDSPARGPSEPLLAS